MEQLKLYTCLLIRKIIAKTTEEGTPLTQKKISKLINLSEAQVSRLYQGKSTISGKTLAKLQRLGHITIGDKFMSEFNSINLPQLE